MAEQLKANEGPASVNSSAPIKSKQAPQELLTLAWPVGARLNSFSYRRDSSIPQILPDAQGLNTVHGGRPPGLLHSTAPAFRKTVETREDPEGP